MLTIHCPWCGARAQTEFTYEGDATVTRPSDPSDTSEFHEYVYLRDNPRGWHDELWQHTSGCRRFLTVRRHMTTHEIAATAKPGEPLPEVADT